MSKIRYGHLRCIVFVCVFSISLAACANEQVSTPPPVSIPTQRPASRSLPDLVIVNGKHNFPVDFFCKSDNSDPFTFTAPLFVEIANVGEARAGSFQVDAGNKILTLIPRLGPGERTTVITHVHIGGEPTKVVVDLENEVPELDESNNTFLVQEPIPPCIASSDIAATPEPEALQELEHELIALYPAGEPVNITELNMLEATQGYEA